LLENPKKEDKAAGLSTDLGRVGAAAELLFITWGAAGGAFSREVAGVG